MYVFVWAICLVSFWFLYDFLLWARARGPGRSCGCGGGCGGGGGGRPESLAASLLAVLAYGALSGSGSGFAAPAVAGLALFFLPVLASQCACCCLAAWLTRSAWLAWRARLASEPGGDGERPY